MYGLTLFFSSGYPALRSVAPPTFRGERFALDRTAKLRHNQYMDIDELKAVVTPVCRTFGVNRLEAFGSIARGTANASSDIDLLVEFANPDSNPAKRFFGLLHRLEDCFRCRVDLLTPSGIRNPFFKAQVLREKVPLYEA